MKLELMLDAAVILSAHGPHLIESLTPPPQDMLQRFWSLSRARFRHWQRQITAFSESVTPESQWDATEQSLVALFSSEVLTRIACTLLAASDARRAAHDGSAIGRNVFLGHLDVRKHGLSLLLNEKKGQSVQQLAALDQLRRRAERWTDVLLGQLVVRYGVHEFAFDADRSRDFGIEQLRMVTSPKSGQLWELYRISLRAGFSDVPAGSTLDDQFRKSMVQCLLSWVPSELFDDAGVLESPWVSRFLQDREPNRTVGLPGGLGTFRNLRASRAADRKR